MSDLIERLRLNQGEIFGPTMQEAANEIERLQRENEEVMRQKAYQYQRAKKAEEELAALKAQSTEPVAWMSRHAELLRINGALGAEVSFVNLGWTNQIALYTTPPTATALVEDFRKRAVDVCEAHASHWKTFGSSFYSSVAEHLKKKIESLPLIQGE